eukprot:2971045-Pyramimonas_sp.AAC.1
MVTGLGYGPNSGIFLTTKTRSRQEARMLEYTSFWPPANCQESIRSVFLCSGTKLANVPEQSPDSSRFVSGGTLFNFVF